MRLQAECPRCPAPVDEPTASCPLHGVVVPLWRVAEPCYEAFTEYLLTSRGLPTWLPWPLPLGWQLMDFGCVADGGPPSAAFVTCGGPTDLDGPVEVTVLTEEPGVGLAARCGGIPHADPGRETAGPPIARVQVEGATTPLWAVSTSDADGEALDRAVLVGEAQGRWLWLVLRPASVALSLPQLGALVDVAGLGPPLVSLPFGRAPRSW